MNLKLHLRRAGMLRLVERWSVNSKSASEFWKQADVGNPPRPR